MKVPAFLKRFHKQDRLSRHLKKAQDLSESEQRQKKLRERLFLDHYERQQKKKRRRFKTQELLHKAGVGMDVQRFNKTLFLSAVGITLLITIVVTIFSAINARGAVNLLIFLAGLWTAGFAASYLLVRMAASVFLDMRIHDRRKAIEAVLPDFLQLTAANIGAGMTIDRALWQAVRPRFGILAAEIEDVAKRVVTGEELDVALRNFTRQYDSVTLQRSINLLLEGVAAGGKVADLLHRISVDIQEQRILEQEMAANVMTYVIFITFASIIAAPVLLGLSSELLRIIQAIAGNLGPQTSGSFFSVSPDVIKLSDFRIFSMVSLTITAIFSSMIIATITKGNASESLRFLPIYVVVSLILYVLSTWLFSLMFSGLA